MMPVVVPCNMDACVRWSPSVKPNTTRSGSRTARSTSQRANRDFTLVPCCSGSHASTSLRSPGHNAAFLGQGLTLQRAMRQRTARDVFPFDQAWGPSVDVNTWSQTISSNLFAVSIIPYAGFLFHLTTSKKTPPLALFGFYFLLVFVAATIPAGIYAKNVYGTSLANVDWLHGTAESLLTVTNLMIVLGFRQAIQSELQKSKATVEDVVKTSSTGDSAEPSAK